MALMEKSNHHDLLQAHDELWQHSLSYLKSLALAVALDLRIPDAIHHHGGGATLPQILAETAIHPCKLRALRRLMRALTVSGTFSVVVQQPPPANSSPGDDSTVAGADAPDDEAAVVYGLTAASRLLVSDEASSATTTLAPFMRVLLRPISTCPHAAAICAWFRQEHRDPSVFGLAFRRAATIWERADDKNAVLNEGLAAHSRFLMPIVLGECGEAVFGGIDSLVDVGGGHGGAAIAIAEAFPRLKCTVLDLPHVVASAPPSDRNVNVKFVAGDMFQSIPPATAVLLKKTLHDWGDDECVKILKNCRQAIAPRDAGGKVIILDMVVGQEKKTNIKNVEAQVMFDLFIMMVNGAERDEQEWKKIFIEAGFKDYKIIPIAGILSVIEVYS